MFKWLFGNSDRDRVDFLRRMIAEMQVTMDLDAETIDGLLADLRAKDAQIAMLTGIIQAKDDLNVAQAQEIARLKEQVDNLKVMRQINARFFRRPSSIG